MKLIIFILFFLLSKISIAENFSQQRIDDRITQMEKDLSMLQKQFYQQGGAPKATDIIDNQNLAGSLEARLQELEEQIRNLTGKVEEANHADEVIVGKFDNLKKDVDFRLTEFSEKLDNLSNKMSQENLKKENTSNKTPIKNTEKKDKKSDSNDVNEEYEKAFALLKAGNHPEAEKEFKNFIAKHKDHKLAGSAYYWLGESYLAQEDFDNAALNFLYSYKKFPKANKAPNALYKLGLTLSKLGKKKEACDSFVKLLENFPDISSAIKSGTEKQIKNLKCES